MDFLFDYYPYSPGRLGTWHPGLGVCLEGDWEPSSNSHAYTHDGTAWGVDPLAVDRARLALALGILKGTQRRAAQHSCFGMHEWAMVYQTRPSDVRHESESLRLSPTEITEVVDNVGLRCTHIDAFRFFTAEAEPLNEHTPTRARQAHDEQPGCIHANMDLYKYAMWFQPYIPGNLVVDCFELSVDAREIDMRASPYDLEHLGYAPIAVETINGRREYAFAQRDIDMRASPYDLEHLGYAPIAVETINGRREYAFAQRDIAAKADSLRQRLITGLTAVDTAASASTRHSATSRDATSIAATSAG